MVRADSLAALLAVIPASARFVTGLTPPRGRVVRVTFRYDLPHPPEAHPVADIAGHAVGVISSQQLTAASGLEQEPPCASPAASSISPPGSSADRFSAA